MRATVLLQVDVDLLHLVQGVLIGHELVSGPGPPHCVGRIGGWQRWGAARKASTPRSHIGQSQGASERKAVAENSWTKPTLQRIGIV